MLANPTLVLLKPTVPLTLVLLTPTLPLSPWGGSKRSGVSGLFAPRHVPLCDHRAGLYVPTSRVLLFGCLLLCAGDCIDTPDTNPKTLTLTPIVHHRDPSPNPDLQLTLVDNVSNPCRTHAMLLTWTLPHHLSARSLPRMLRPPRRSGRQGW